MRNPRRSDPAGVFLLAQSRPNAIVFVSQVAHESLRIVAAMTL